MAGLNPHELTQPIYVRLPIKVSEEIRRQAMQQERNLSSQIRFLVLKALQMPEGDKNKEE
jgi:CopG-like RHH_1 or ribbon-helix-helix domain, RHH_5